MIIKTTIGAFVERPETQQAVEALQGERTFMRSVFHVQQGGVAGALEYLGGHDTPYVLIVETGSEGDAFFAELEALANVCAPNTQLFLIGRSNDVNLFKELINQGVAQYFVGGVTSQELMSGILDLFTEDDAEDLGRVYAFTGVRGGVGSSVVSHNVAWELAEELGDDVILVDLDLPFGTAALNFNIQPRYTLGDALSQANRLDEVVVERFVEQLERNFGIFCSPASLNPGGTLTIEGLDVVLRFLRKMADHVVLDIPHVWTSWSRELLIEADEVVLVAKPDLTNLRDAKNLVELLAPERGVDAPTRLAFNRMGEAKQADLTDKDFEEVLNMRPTVEIPFDPVAFGTAMNNGDMLRRSAKKSKATEAIRRLAMVVSGEMPATPEKKTGFSLNLSMLGKKAPA